MIEFEERFLYENEIGKHRYSSKYAIRMHIVPSMVKYRKKAHAKNPIRISIAVSKPYRRFLAFVYYYFFFSIRSF
jgi:hypothetical protein